MKTAIMQPYFLPYLGYFQLISAADVFVVYDTVQYTKKGWINRNRMLRNGTDTKFSIPLKKDSDFLDISERCLSDTFDPVKLCNQIKGAYGKAPEFKTTMPLIEKIALYKSSSLFDFAHNSIRQCCDYLNITTPIRISSEVEGGVSNLHNTDRVIDICHRLGATGYINPPGGRGLYKPDIFQGEELKLQFIQPRMSDYPQFGAAFVPALSILDVMMFNSKEYIASTLLGEYDLAD